MWLTDVRSVSANQHHLETQGSHCSHGPDVLRLRWTKNSCKKTAKGPAARARARRSITHNWTQSISLLARGCLSLLIGWLHHSEQGGRGKLRHRRGLKFQSCGATLIFIEKNLPSHRTVNLFKWTQAKLHYIKQIASCCTHKKVKSYATLFISSLPISSFYTD